MKVLESYEALIASGELEPDAAQAEAARKLDGLAAAVEEQRGSGLARRLNPFARKSEPVRGLYLFGEVGRGKSMLMNLFYESAAIPGARRMHFQEFMSEAHDAIEAARKGAARDAVPVAAETLARDLTLLCLDELEIADIADAMVVGRLFEALFARSVTIVATSNTAPKDLYKGGLNRQLFLPFIDLIEDRMAVLELAAAKDYRLERLAGSDLYLSPAGSGAEDAMDRTWQRLTGRRAGEAETLTVKGRRIEVPQAAMGVARFAFADLCERPLGPEDYQRIARTYHTVMIDGIPLLTPERQNAARRLTTLIDALYDNGVGLIASAEAEPDRLYRGDSPQGFLRTASRLMEMRSLSWLKKRHRSPAAAEPA